MKSLLLFLLLALFVSLASSAQTQKGAMMIGGDGSANFKDGFSISFDPNLGFFVIDNFAVGSGVPLGYYNRKEYNTVTGGLQPFVRYYYGRLGATRVFGQLDGMLIWFRSKSTEPGVPKKISTNSQNSFGGGLGLVHFVTEQVGIEAQLEYLNYQAPPGPRSDVAGLSLGIQIHLINSKKHHISANSSADH